MKSLNNNKLFIFFHLRKSGGTTINGHFKKHLLWDEEFIHLANWGEKYRKENNCIDFEKRDNSEKEKIKVLSGHKTYYGIHKHFINKTPYYIAIMRSPADQIVSIYNFEKSKNIIKKNFEDWYNNTYKVKNRNFICNFYAKKLMPINLNFSDNEKFELAKKLFDKCDFILLTHKLDEDLPKLFNLMNLPTSFEKKRVTGYKGNALEGLNHTKKIEFIKQHYKLNNGMKKQINQENYYDLKLFEYASELNKKKPLEGELSL
ncbi:MAG: sulfotransferase family 2 domain-containing protein [Halarcobacter sp.]